MTGRSITLCILASLLLAACGSSPPVRYFSLSTTVAAAQDPDDAIILGLGPLQVPEYLNRSQLVTRERGSEMKVHEFIRWAEPLDTAMHRIVAADVDSLMDTLVVFPFPWESVLQNQVDYRLLGDILRFESDYAGRVVLEVQWGVTTPETHEILIRPRRSVYESGPVSSDDPAAIASAMNEALAKFSRDIAGQLRSSLQ